MKRLLALAMIWSCSLVAEAALPTVGLPNGARWAVIAPRADRFAKEAGALLEAAAKSDPPLSPRMLNNDFVRGTGLALLSAQELQATGIDVTRGWTMFERQGATFLEVSVKSRAPLQAALEGWGASRLLKAREEKAGAGGRGVVVTFARAKGTRAAAGYLIVGDRAIILLRPSDRTPALEQALVAVENAPPVRASVDGTMLVWFEAGPFGRDAWFGLQASDKGLDLTGSARELEAGWAVADPAKAAWVGALAAAAAKDEQVLRLRFVAGDKAARALARAFTQASGPDDAKAQAAVEAAAKGPVELFVPRLVPPTSGSGVNAEAILNVFSPALALPERAGRAAEVAKAAKGSTGTFRLSTSSGALVVGLGESSPRAVAAEPTGLPALGCGKARPLASLRFDGTAIDRSIEGIGLFGAMRDELLMGLFGLHSEFGLLLRRLEPLVAVACQDGPRTTLVGKLHFRER